MSNRSNLTPTVITDRNGKTTTVHKKQASASTKPPVLPAPTTGVKAKRTRKLSPHDEEMMQIMERGKLVESITDRLFKDARIRRTDSHDASLIASRLRGTKDNDYLRTMVAVAEFVSRDDISIDVFFEGRDTILRSVKEETNSRIHPAEMRSIIAYRDLIAADDIPIKKFKQMMSAVYRNWSDHISSGGASTTIEAHMKLMLSDASPTLWSGTREIAYGTSNPISCAAEKYPEHVDQLITYVTERGSKNFTEQAFLGYVNVDAPPLREGWL